MQRGNVDDLHHYAEVESNMRATDISLLTTPCDLRRQEPALVATAEAKLGKVLVGVLLREIAEDLSSKRVLSSRVLEVTPDGITLGLVIG